MNILHYGLGFPPYRTGGLTKFCVDLMIAQKESGNSVGLLWPGEINPLKKQAIVRRKDCFGLKSFEIINPLPIALDEGILDIEPYMKKGVYKVFEKFLKKFKPDVLHIHTFMGFNKEIIEAAKNLKIKTVYTSHDYYGLCPKLNFFKGNCACENNNGFKDCIKCNKSALSMKKIMIMQSPFYRVMKNTKVVKILRKKHRAKFFDEFEVENKPNESSKENLDSNYKKLKSFYVDMFEKIDLIHFNSEVTKGIYEKHIKPKKSKVLAISHCGIKDNKKVKVFDEKKLKITYLSPTRAYKGFNVLKEALDELWAEKKYDFELKIFNETENKSPYMTQRSGFKQNELEEIFNDTDVLVAPSLWFETFGFTVLEALSYGVPVIVSENVGAKILLKDKFGIVCSPDKKGVKSAILKLFDVKELEKINKNIVNEFDVPYIKDIVKRLYI